MPVGILAYGNLFSHHGRVLWRAPSDVGARHINSAGNPTAQNQPKSDTVARRCTRHNKRGTHHGFYTLNFKIFTTTPAFTPYPRGEMRWYCRRIVTDSDNGLKGATKSSASLNPARPFDPPVIRR
jgi:hypothetical protein